MGPKRSGAKRNHNGDVLSGSSLVDGGLPPSQPGNNFVRPRDPPLQQTEKSLPLATVPDPSDDVYIDVEPSVQALKDYIKQVGTKRYFIRGGVGIGKTTLITRGLEKDPEFHIGSPSDTVEKLEEDSKGKRFIVFDEAHSVLVNQGLMQAFKDKFSSQTIIFISASARAHSNTEGELTLTPSSEWHRVFWTPPQPDANSLVAQLKGAGLDLTADAVMTLCNYCSNHRNILMFLLAGLKSFKGIPSKSSSTIVEFLVSEEGWSAARNSRAVKVNSMFSDTSNIPEDFIKTLSNGEHVFSNIADERNCMIRGLVLPARVHTPAEFSSFQWSNLVRVAHPMMAWHYFSVYEKDYGIRRVLKADLKVKTCFDIMLLLVPMLAPHTIVPQLLGTQQGALSHKTGLPYESQFTARMVEAAQSLGLRTNSLENPTHGKIDFTMSADNTTFGIEALMLGPKDQADEHLGRFRTRHNYSTLDCKSLLFIRHSNTKLPDWFPKFVDEATHAGNAEDSEAKDRVSVLDLAVDAGLRTFTLTNCGSKVPQSFAMEADGVPRRLAGDKLESAITYRIPLSLSRAKSVWVKYGDAVFEVVPAANTVYSLKDAVKAKRGIVEGPLPLLVWNVAREALGDSAPLTANSMVEPYIIHRQQIWVRYGDAVFEVVPAANTVDSLKDAVKAKWDASNPGNVLNIFTLVVKDHTLTVLEVDSLLESNNKDTAYVVESK